MQVSSYTFQTPYPQAMQVGRPDPSMVKAQSETTNEQLDKMRENATGLLDTKSKQDQAEIYVKSSAMYQNDSSSNTTALSVKDYMMLSKDAQRSQNLNTYVNNGGDFSALTRVDAKVVLL